MKVYGTLSTLVLGVAALAATPALAETKPLPLTQAPAQQEVGYDRGALAYEALMAGNNTAALAKLEAATGDEANDPARQINLGRAYARVGRFADAEKMFKAAATSREPLMLVLADGRVINSAAAARQALVQLNAQRGLASAK